VPAEDLDAQVVRVLHDGPADGGVVQVEAAAAPRPAGSQVQRPQKRGHAARGLQEPPAVDA
jgi:hypothetical protein